MALVILIFCIELCATVQFMILIRRLDGIETKLEQMQNEPQDTSNYRHVL